MAGPGLAEMLRSGGGGGEGAAPPPPEGAPESGPMGTEEAISYMESKGLTPQDLPQLIAAIQAITAPQGGGDEPPPDAAPEMG